MYISSGRSRVEHLVIQPALLCHLQSLEIAVYSKGVVPPTVKRDEPVQALVPVWLPCVSKQRLTLAVLCSCAAVQCSAGVLCLQSQTWDVSCCSYILRCAGAGGSHLIPLDP